jgi:hypothetical protein
MWNQEYVQMIEYFECDMDFMSWYRFVEDYIQAFRIKRVVEIPHDGHQSYDPLESKLKDASKMAIANQDIETTLGTPKEKLFEAVKLENTNHYDNECIKHAFIDHYEYALMKDNKRTVIIRSKLIMMMGNTEQDFINKGATINIMEPICINYRLKVRIVDAFTAVMNYKYGTPFADSDAKSFVCMIKHNRICVLNYDLISLEQKAVEGDKKSLCI